MSSLFKKPDEVANITFMIRGEAGAGKTRFSLAAARATGKRVAYIGNDRGAKFYRAEFDFEQVETSDIKLVRQAVAELEQDNGKTFAAVVVDTVTGIWDSEQAEYERKDDDGQTFIPMRAWRPLREGHEQLLRRLQGLACHVFLICEEKPIYAKQQRGKQVELVEVGSKEDADKRDSYVSDVRLRFFLDDKKFKATVLKDRTGTFAMGHVIENPRPEMWIKGAPTAKPVQAPAASSPPLSAPPVSGGAPQSFVPGSMDDILRKEVDRLKALMQFNDPKHADNWRAKHRHEWESFPAWATKELKAYYDAQVEACRNKKQAVMELSGELAKKMKEGAA